MEADFAKSCILYMHNLVKNVTWILMESPCHFMSQINGSLLKIDTKFYDYFITRSKNYRNVFNADVKFVVPKDSTGKWMPGYDEFSNKFFVEGNGWEYSFYVPHDED